MKLTFAVAHYSPTPTDWPYMRKYLSDLLPQTNPELIKKGSPTGPGRHKHTFSVSHTDWMSLTLLLCLGISGGPCSEMRACLDWQKVTEFKQRWLRPYWFPLEELAPVSDLSSAESFQTIGRLGVISTRGGLDSLSHVTNLCIQTRIGLMI